MELAEFITARLDEDEAVARDAEGACWHVEYCDDSGRSFHVRHDPARVLRDVAAKRRILKDVVEQIDDMDARIESEWGSGYHTTGESDLLLSLLAAPYSDHPDYRAEWAPTKPAHSSHSATP